MKFIIIAVLLAASPVSAQSLGEKTGVNELLDKPPTATDVLLEIHQFDLFQQQVSDSADKRGDDGVKAVSKAASAAAGKRGNELLAVQKKAELKFAFPEDVSQARDNRLGGLSGSVAEVYIKNFYKAQHDEYESVLSTSKRYLAKPDNDVVRAFVEKQVPVLEADLKKLDVAQTVGPVKPAAKEQKSNSK